jgi:glycosyltransferase involved in cell wall biosynthesis
MPPAVLFISTMNGDPWGGSEEFWYRIAVWMAENGYRVECCFFEWPAGVAGKQNKINRMKEAGCHVHLIPNPRLAKNVFYKMATRKKGFSMLKELCTKEWHIVCISQGGYEDVTHRPFRFLHKYLKQFALVYHNYNESHHLSGSRIGNLNTWVNKALLNMGDAGRIFEGVKKITGIIVPRQYVLKNPLTISYQHQPPAWPVTDEKGRYVFAMLAQLDIARKAQDVLIKTLSTSKWKERNWILYLYGGGEDSGLLENLIRANGMNDQIKLMGHTTNVYEVLQKTHLLFQVTHIDAMPLSVTEAMNMARPCIVSRVGDMPLWVEHGKNGYIAASATEPEIDNVLEQAWQEKAGWEQMGLEGYRIFTEKYPQPYEKYYSDLLMNL